VSGLPRPLPAVQRVDTKDLPPTSWTCFLLGHAWGRTSSRVSTGWGPTVDAELQLYECMRDGCTRWRRDTTNAVNGELLNRDYGGGIYVHAGNQPSKAEARQRDIQERRWERAQADRLEASAARRRAQSG
jgi:hypothetical protein